jgi:hypothetical protein
MRPRRILLSLVLATAAMVPSIGAHAEGTGTYPRRDAPFILRSELNLLFFSLSNADGFAALTAGYSVVQWLAIEATGGLGVGNNVKGDTGVHLMLAGRLAGSISDNHRHALTVAAGPLLVTGGGYGNMAIAHGEAGYEYRRATGVTVLLAAGMGILLNDSAVPQPLASCAGFFAFCPGQLKRGEPATHFRLGLGLSF